MMPERLNSSVEEYVIGDSIESWSLAIGRLVQYYFNSNVTYPKFDYSKIRPSGSLISGGFIAPGPDGLRNALNKIDSLLSNVHKTTRRLSPLNCADILSHCADSVLSGGVRRSALAILFSPNDEEMYNSKVGNWFYDNPQRGRYNASVALERSDDNKEVFNKIFESTKEYGEPGFFFRSDSGIGCNPCQPKWATVITKSGISTIGDINIGDEIWSSEGWTKVINKWSTGVKQVNEYRTSGGVFYGTENHKIISKGKKVEVKDCDSIDSLSGEYTKESDFNFQTIMDGLIIGDGFVHNASNNLICLCIGEDDSDYFNSEISSFIRCHRPGINKCAWEVTTTLDYTEVLLKPQARIPERFMHSSKTEIRSLLRGLYTANGSVVKNRITYKTTSPILRDQIQLLLSYLGIDSYYTTNKPKIIKFDNGDYECKESYDINISTDYDKFITLIGFIQQYKTNKILKFKSNPKNRKFNRKLIYIKPVSEEEVFDLTVDNSSHTYWTGGLNVSNCFEIGFKPVLEIQKPDGVSKQTGIQFCNLISISGKESTTEEKFYKQCKAAATIGTIQATYNSFPFLGEVTEQLAKNDPLIGVSISGIMMNPDILLNENILRKGAEIIKEQNSKIANLLRINPASRTTCIKPDGNISTLTGNTPGCHGQHAKRYIRRVQVNKEEEAGKVYAKYNPKAVVESVWSNNHTDNCIMFAIESDDNVKTKSELLGIKQLEVIKLLYNNWILPGMVDPTNPVCNNVSNTVIVPNQDWHRVKDWVWNNKNFIAGVSFIPSTGDITFTQPPYSEVFIPEELVEMYGDGVIFASGLIVDAEKTFGNLWKACDTFNYKGEKLYSTVEDAKEFIKELNVAEDPSYLNKPHSEWVKANSIQYNNWVKVLSILGYTEEFIDEILDSDIEIPIAEIQKYLDKTAFTNIKNLNTKRDIMRRMKKFGDTYFGEDYSTMIEALKYVQLYHDWCDITRNYTPIDWTTVKWKKVLIDADTTGAQACSGGQCDITKI